jgi:hypothetical protein
MSPPHEVDKIANNLEVELARLILKYHLCLL